MVVQVNCEACLSIKPHEAETETAGPHRGMPQRHCASKIKLHSQQALTLGNVTGGQEPKAGMSGVHKASILT